MPRGEYLEGLVFALPTFVFCVLAGSVVVRRHHRGAGATVVFLATFVYASAAAVLAHLGPMALGVLSRGSVLLAALITLGVAWWAARRFPQAAPAARAGSARGTEPASSWALGGMAALVAFVGLVAWADVLSREPVLSIDALTFHLTQAARWIQTGSVWQQDQFTPDLSNWAYPHNGNVMQLALVLPWRATFAAPMLGLPLLGVLGVAVYAAAVEVGAPRPSALAAAAAVVTVPAVYQPALEQAQVDISMLAWAAAGAFFLLRHVRRPDRRDLVVAGIALGLAFGTKWYAVAYAPVIVVAFAAAAARLRGRPAVREPAMLTALIVLGGGFWLLRNWVVAGNPVHPAPVEVAGVEIFGAPYDNVRELGGWSVSHYLFDIDVWRDYFVDAFERSWGLAGPLLLAAAVVAAAVALRRRPRDLRPVALGAIAVVIAGLYTRLPYTALGPEGAPVQTETNTRYLLPAFLAAAPAAAWLAGTAGRWRFVVEALLLVAVVDGARRGLELELRGVVTAVLLFALGAAAARAAVVVGRRAASVDRNRVLAVGTLVALAALVLAGDRLRARSSYLSYAAYDQTFAWAEHNLAPGSRIGLASVWSNGVSPVLPLFGPRLENEVEYVGRFEDDTLRAYRDAAGFARAVADGGYDALLVGRGFPRPVADARVSELGWSRTAGYREVARSPRFVLLAQP